MKTLLVGSGGREHALAWRISQNHRLEKLWVAGGNAGTATLAENIDVNPEDIDAVVSIARSIRADLVVVGPEAPLALGLVDRLTGLGIPAFGPTRAAAQIEASKSFALEVMREASVPCPDFQVFDDESEALAFLETHPGPMVVKADGLAAGKGGQPLPYLRRILRRCARLHVRQCFRRGRTYRRAGGNAVRPGGQRFSPSPTARRSLHWRRPVTTRGSMTATKAPTPAAWAALPRRTSGTRTWPTK